MPEALPAARPALHLARTLLLSNCALTVLRRLFLTSKWTWAVLCIGRMRVWPLIGQTYHLDFSNPWVTTIYIFVSALQPCQLLFPKIKISECKGEGVPVPSGYYPLSVKKNQLSFRQQLVH